MDREQTGDDEAGLREPDRVFRVARAVHVIVLSLYVGGIVVAGAMAAVVFPLMKRLDPDLPSISMPWVSEWRIAGGEVMTPVFEGVYVYGGTGVLFVTVAAVLLMFRRRDQTLWLPVGWIAMLSIVFGVVAPSYGVLMAFVPMGLVVLVLSCRDGIDRSWVTVCWGVAAFLGLGLFTPMLIDTTVGMSESFDTLRRAAEGPDRGAYQSARNDFDRMHDGFTRTATVHLVFVLLTIVFGSFVQRRDVVRTEEDS